MMPPHGFQRAIEGEEMVMVMIVKQVWLRLTACSWPGPKLVNISRAVAISATAARRPEGSSWIVAQNAPGEMLDLTRTGLRRRDS